MIEPPETPHVGHRKAHVNWFDACMALGVLAISLGSLYVALHTGHTMENLVKQNERLVRAQSTPILQFDHGNVVDGRATLNVNVTNVGSGAARVAWVRFTHDGQSFVNWTSLVDRLHGAPLPVAIETAPIERTVMSAGEKRDLFNWREPQSRGEERAVWTRLNTERWKVTAESCFCSLFDECWTSRMGADLPVRVESCEAPRPIQPVDAH